MLQQFQFILSRLQDGNVPFWDYLTLFIIMCNMLTIQVTFFRCGLTTSAFNMLPVGCLDGGRAVQVISHLLSSDFVGKSTYKVGYLFKGHYKSCTLAIMLANLCSDDWLNFPVYCDVSSS